MAITIRGLSLTLQGSCASLRFLSLYHMARVTVIKFKSGHASPLSTFQTLHLIPTDPSIKSKLINCNENPSDLALVYFPVALSLFCAPETRLICCSLPHHSTSSCLSILIYFLLCYDASNPPFPGLLYFVLGILAWESSL